MKYWYDIDNEPLPEAGKLHVLTNWHGDPTSIIETTYVQQCKFKDVRKEFAAAEGEGDKSLDYWRQIHWDFFSTECEKIDLTPSDEMELVLENFKVIYKL